MNKKQKKNSKFKFGAEIWYCWLGYKRVSIRINWICSLLFNTQTTVGKMGMDLLGSVVMECGECGTWKVNVTDSVVAVVNKWKLPREPKCELDVNDLLATSQIWLIRVKKAKRKGKCFFLWSFCHNCSGNQGTWLIEARNESGIDAFNTRSVRISCCCCESCRWYSYFLWHS